MTSARVPERSTPASTSSAVEVNPKGVENVCHGANVRPIVTDSKTLLTLVPAGAGWAGREGLRWIHGDSEHTR